MNTGASAGGSAAHFEQPDFNNTSDSAAMDRSPRDVGSAPTRCWRLGLTVFVQYFLLALDIRFVAAKNYAGIIVVNALIALMGWYVVKGIVRAHAAVERVAYVVGGTCGAVTAVWLS
jgi:hypothetical protein